MSVMLVDYTLEMLVDYTLEISLVFLSFCNPHFILKIRELLQFISFTVLFTRRINT